MKTLGLDIGSNSVGSAWVDTERKTIRLGVGVFPAGVAITETKRGEPKNQARHSARSMMRMARRRAERKRKLRTTLVEHGLLPKHTDDYDRLVRFNRWPILETPRAEDKDRTVWHLRVEALERELHPYELGRVLVHMNQRRGTLGVDVDSESSEEGEIKKAIIRLTNQLDGRTIGEFMLAAMLQRRTPTRGKNTKYVQDPIRNRRDEILRSNSDAVVADRSMVRDEFDRIWKKQTAFDGPLSALLTDSLKQMLDNPETNEVWREQGAIFGQRKTYWDTGTLGRCDLEPTDRCCPLLDMHAQHYRIIETVNNIQITKRGMDEEALSFTDRSRVIAALRKKKSGSIATVRKALKIDQQSLKKTHESEDFYVLNIERDEKREINTDCFWREIVHGVFGEDCWEQLEEQTQESVNRALLHFDKVTGGHEQRLRNGAKAWWGLNEEQAETLVMSWKRRGSTEKRLNLSRRAIRNLLPYMNEYDNANKRWPTQIEARQKFALDPDAIDQTTGKPVTPEQRVRYAHGISEKLQDVLLTQLGGDEDEYNRLLKLRGSTKASRHFENKHPELLPPAPEMANPVVRKAIHEVRRHVMAHIASAGCKPDRVVIELAREARQSGKVRQATLDRNRDREKIRKEITLTHQLAGLSGNQIKEAQNRVLLCRRQQNKCAYTSVPEGKAISERHAAWGHTDDGRRLEIDHVIPKSRSGDDSLNNKVLCYVEQNRGKGHKTPKEWWGDAFEERLKPLAFIKSFSPAKSDYFTKKDYARLWENLTRDFKPGDEWRNSQLSDAAYAATQVMEYLRDALFDGVQKSIGGKGVYETNGRYTAMLRRDWQLQSDDGKDRDDHRHHAVDAVVIALTEPYKLLPVLADQAKDAEEYHDRTGYWPKRDPEPTRALLPDVWKNHLELRQQVIELRDELVVSHRPVKTKLVGGFHKDQLFAPVMGRENSYTIRKNIEDIEKGYVKPLRPKKHAEIIKRIAKDWERKYLKRGSTPREATTKAREQAKRIVESPGFTPKLYDPDPGPNSYIVRDRGLRERLRKCIDEWCQRQNNGRDADSFTSADVRQMIDQGAFQQQSGVPIHSVVLMRTFNDPVEVPRRYWDHDEGEWKEDKHPAALRVYDGGNIHHVEIRENEKGEWSGRFVSAYEASKRINPRRGVQRKSVVDRADDPDGDGRFVMSLAEGESVRMLDPESGALDVFVVSELSKARGTIGFKHNRDARPATEKKDSVGNAIADSKRRELNKKPGQLKMDCSLPDGTPPVKICVSPLGKITEVDDRIRSVDVTIDELNPHIVAIAREAIELRAKYPLRRKDKDGRPLHGSWRWMARQLGERGLDEFASQLTPALHLLDGDSADSY